eukprot:TCONS_00030505-protein
MVSVVDNCYQTSSLTRRASVNEISIAMGQDMLKSKLQAVVFLLKEKQQQAPDQFADAPPHSKSIVVDDVNQGKMMLQAKLLKLAEEMETKQPTPVPILRSLETPWYLNPLDIRSIQEKKRQSTKPVFEVTRDGGSLSTTKPHKSIDLLNPTGKLLTLRPSMRKPRLPKVNGEVAKNIEVFEIKKEELGGFPPNETHLAVNSPKPFSRFRRRNVLTSPLPSGRMAPCPPRHLKLPQIQLNQRHQQILLLLLLSKEKQCIENLFPPLVYHLYHHSTEI